MSRIAAIRLAVLVGLVAALEILIRAGYIPRRTILPPSEMADALARLLAAGTATRDIVQTLTCVAAALASSVVVGFGLGVLIHRVPRLRRALEPFFATYYAVPFFIFYPVLIAIFDLSLLPIILMGFAFAVVAMTIATLNGLDRVPRVLGKVARVHRMDEIETAYRMKLPAAAPHLFTGLKLCVAYSFIGVIASEFILAPSGLGHAIAYAYNDFDNRTMYALMLFVLTVVIAINMLLHGWEHRLLRRWQGR
jgi:NitT/TauT family transport system permease protein